ncbi:MAG TPA: hypothetical protein DCO79_12055 [Spirochaeta sp.]|nr:hypothetical protein [Spirochaeta sp.]
MAKDTRDKLINSSRILFAQNWYETVSVAEICRHAGLSNGVFYRYFKSKEELFRALIDDFLVCFRQKLETIDGNSLDVRLHSFFIKVYRICFDMAPDVTIFREGQYRFPEYEANLRTLYVEALEKVYKRTVDEAEYLYITAGLRFLNTRALYDEVKFEIKIVERFILKGVFNNESAEELKFLEPGPFDSNLNDNAANRLIHAGIRLFGERGFTSVNVFEIAREADLSVGAFYLYFPSKENFLAKIVSYIGHSVRYYLRNKQVLSHNRLNQELEGMWNFVNYFKEFPEFYEIIREAEFVSREWVKDYYDRFARGYEKNMDDYPEQEQRTMANFLIGLNHYLGIEMVLCERRDDLAEIILRMGEFLSEGIQV